jgi:hypothetical protein
LAAGTAHLSLGGFVAAGLVNHRHVGPACGHGGVPLAPDRKLLQHGQELGGGLGGRVPLAGATRAVVVDADQQAGIDHGVESAAEHGFGDAEALAQRVESSSTMQHVTDDKQHPRVAQHVQRTANRAPVAALAEHTGWRPASLALAAAALTAVPLVWLVIRDYPQDRGVLPYGADPDSYVTPARAVGGAVARALEGLAYATRRREFLALAIAFAICGATTNGLIGIHFIPSAHDHGMSATTAAGLLAVVGVFDIAGTIASGWLTDKFDPRKLLVAYYGFRGVGLLLLPWLLADRVHPSMILFVVIYGLDWVATVPPTAALSRELFGDRGTIVFGWVFASHQLGAATAAFGAGVIRDVFGTYTYAWWGGAALCLIAASLSILVNESRRVARDAASATVAPATTERTRR